jgi:hypothetical protein
MGAHYNPLLLSTDLGQDPSPAEALLRTSERAVPALDRQRLPYSVLAGHLHHAHGWQPNSTPAAMFLMDRYPLEGLHLKGCQVTGLYLDHGTTGDAAAAAVLPAATTAGLSVFVRETGTRLTVSTLAPPDTLKHAEVTALTWSYVELLAALCDTPEVPLSQIELSLTDPPDPPAPLAPSGAATGPTLRPVTEFAPVEALSPVGVWATHS